MNKFERQYNLFNDNELIFSEKNPLNDLNIDKNIIKQWQRKILSHQTPIFKKGFKNINQPSFFDSSNEKSTETFNPEVLTPQPLSFWRWPKTMHAGPAVYFVMDYIDNLNESIILYIGETVSAEHRWKGEHDCKNYLSNYSEILQKANVPTNLNIRFWLDVPTTTRERRKLEQKLIQIWLPPFNRETRGIWSTPFTSQIN